jgi:SulP family sulfate permease
MSHSAPSDPVRPVAARWVPALGWLRHYRRDWLAGDVMAGVVVAIMLVPQGMAYALLAGLPPQTGLYAGIVPLILYGLLGTSSALAVGPVAIVSILTASGVGGLAVAGSAEYLQLALTLALLVGVIQTGMGLFRLGFLVNFLSHPVLTGFAGAAALVIGLSQAGSLLGFPLPRSDNFFSQLWYLLTHLDQTRPVTLLISGAGLALLLLFRGPLNGWLVRLGLPGTWRIPLTKGGPLLLVATGALLVWGLGLHERFGLAIVGAVPAGLPPLTRPSLEPQVWRALLVPALAISFVGYMESFSVARTLANRRREKISADHELRALGLANVGAAFTGAFPVTGGFSRSLVNYEAGARTGLASLITALLIALSLLAFSPLFHYIPMAALGVIIIVAVSSLVDVATFRKVWRYSRRDGLALVATFLAVLAVGIEAGIVIGALTSLVMFIAATSTPHVAVIGRLGQSETYRNVKWYPVQTWPELALVRIDASLWFGNCQALEQTVVEQLHAQPDLRHFVLIGTAVNAIDYSALETLESIWHMLAERGITLHLAAIKKPVYERLLRSGLVDLIGPERIHLTTHEAVLSLTTTPAQRDPEGETRFGNLPAAGL